MTIDDCFAHKQLPPISKLVYLFFKHKQQEPVFSMTLVEIAQALSLTKNTVFRALKPLKEWGFLSYEHHGASPTKYHLL